MLLVTELNLHSFQYLIGGVKTCRSLMTGEEHARTVKWEKHKRIQRMDTAVPNKFARAGSTFNV